MASANRSGQITVTTSGTAVQGPNVNGGTFSISALPGNTGVIYVGADATGVDVSSTTGYPLSDVRSITITCDNLSDIWFDASVGGEKVAWFRLK